MKTVAIVYHSKYGQTEKICHYIRNRLIDQGFGVEVLNIDAPEKPELEKSVSAVIVAAPVYAGQFSKDLIRWVKNRKPALIARETAFFSVSLNSADRRPQARKDDDRLLLEFIKATSWSPNFIASIAGAIKYKDYWWPIRYVLRRISRDAGGPLDTSQNYEMTDWTVVDEFVDSFVRHDLKSRYSTSVRFTAGPTKVSGTENFSPDKVSSADTSSGIAPLGPNTPAGNVTNR